MSKNLLNWKNSFIRNTPIQISVVPNFQNCLATLHQWVFVDWSWKQVNKNTYMSKDTQIIETFRRWKFLKNHMLNHILCVLMLVSWRLCWILYVNFFFSLQLKNLCIVYASSKMYKSVRDCSLSTLTWVTEKRRRKLSTRLK